jgi:hypothetical protein
MSRRRFGRLVVLAPWACACYGYYPPAAPAPGVGAQVALTLNDAGSAELARLVGPAAEVLEGRISSDTGAFVVLSMTRVRQHDGSEITWKGERIAVSKTLVSTMRERRFSRGRTGLATALVSGGLAAAITAFGGNGTGKPPGNPGSSGTAK